jgi:hypothetical protein
MPGPAESKPAGLCLFGDGKRLGASVWPVHGQGIKVAAGQAYFAVAVQANLKRWRQAAEQK